MTKQQKQEQSEYWNQREKKRPVLLYILLVLVSMLLAYFVSRAFGQ